MFEYVINYKFKIGAFMLYYANGMPYSDLFIHAKLKNTIEHCRRHCYRTTVKHSITRV